MDVSTHCGRVIIQTDNYPDGAVLRRYASEIVGKIVERGPGLWIRG